MQSAVPQRPRAALAAGARVWVVPLSFRGLSSYDHPAALVKRLGLALCRRTQLTSNVPVGDQAAPEGCECFGGSGLSFRKVRASRVPPNGRQAASRAPSDPA